MLDDYAKFDGVRGGSLNEVFEKLAPSPEVQQFTKAVLPLVAENYIARIYTADNIYTPIPGSVDVVPGNLLFFKVQQYYGDLIGEATITLDASRVEAFVWFPNESGPADAPEMTEAALPYVA